MYVAIAPIWSGQNYAVYSNNVLLKLFDKVEDAIQWIENK